MSVECFLEGVFKTHRVIRYSTFVSAFLSVCVWMAASFIRGGPRWNMGGAASCEHVSVHAVVGGRHSHVLKRIGSQTRLSWRIDLGQRFRGNDASVVVTWVSIRGVCVYLQS